MVTLDDPPEISCNDLVRIACIREYLKESYKNGVIMQVQKTRAIFLKETCKEKSDLLNRHFLQEKWTNQKFLARIVQDLAFLGLFAKFFLFFCKSNALSCNILQETSKNLASFVWQMNQGSHNPDNCHWNSQFCLKCIFRGYDNFFEKRKFWAPLKTNIFGKKYIIEINVKKKWKLRFLPRWYLCKFPHHQNIWNFFDFLMSKFCVHIFFYTL